MLVVAVVAKFVDTFDVSVPVSVRVDRVRADVCDRYSYLHALYAVRKVSC